MVVVRLSRYVAVLILTCTALVADEPPPGLYDRPVLALDPGVHTARISRGDVDAAGRIAVTGSDDRTVRVWSVSDGALLRTIRVPTGPGDVGKIYAVAISPDGTTIAAGGWTRWTGDDRQEQIYLFDARTSAMSGRIEGLESNANGLAFSPDGQRLAAVLAGTGLRLYGRNLAGSWEERARDEDYGDQSYGVAFSPEGQLATTSFDGRLRLYDADGVLLHSVETGRGRPFDAAFNPFDGRLAVGFDDTTEVLLYDGETLAELPAPDVGGVDNGNVSDVAWSKDGAVLIAGGSYIRDGVARVIMWADGGAGMRRSLAAGLNSVTTLRPLPNGALLVASHDPWLGVLEAGGQARWTKAPVQIDARGQDNLAVSPDGMVVEFGLERGGNTERVRFDVGALELTPAPTGDDRAAAPIQDTLDIGDWINKTTPTLAGEQLRLQPYERSRSLAIHPDGSRFLLGADWSLRAFDAYGVEIWQRAVPGAVWAVNVAGDGQLAVAAYGDGTIRWHRMEDGVELLALFPYSDGRNWIVWEPDGRFASTLGARNALRWVVNQGWDKVPLELRAGQVPLSFRPEVIRRILPLMGTPEAVYAAEEAERSLAFSRLTGGVAPGAQLHVLTVGVGDYGAAARKLRLEWADDDAADVAAALSGQVEWPYRPGFQMTLRNEEARGDTILDQISSIKRRMALEPGGRDLAVVMFSGHGVVLDEGGAQEFYLLPYDADVSSASRIKRTGLSGAQLRAEINGLAAFGRVLVLLDACASGAAMAEGAPLGANTEMLRSLAGKNVTVLASSGATEVSREDVEWRNGAFTEVLVEALGKSGDRDGNGMISVAELADYVSRHLPALSGDTQTPSIETRYNGDLFASGL